jgi:hypothetical protein
MPEPKRVRTVTIMFEVDDTVNAEALEEALNLTIMEGENFDLDGVYDLKIRSVGEPRDPESTFEE